ncbi:MAG: hypothetical protein JWO37_162 [Acidimicrobiales bacterium]|nr:hypothetical protein [Acidimicrobiales bacterium]
MPKVPHRLLVLAVASALLLSAIPLTAGAVSPPAVDPGPTPRAICGSGSRPESGMQGRLSGADVDSGRAAKGITCNTEMITRYGRTGGFRVQRYRDIHGHECAYFDSTLMFPTVFLTKASDTSGVWVLDMAAPAHPVRSDVLRTPAMQSPHESLSLNVTRGLLAADLGNLATYPSVFDLYDVSRDCRHPVLKASLPLGVAGHEGAFSPDGRTFWVASPTGTLTAIDVTNPSVPVTVWSSTEFHPHGLNISADGNTLYYGDPTTKPGLYILDVSQVQRRVRVPSVRQLSSLTWKTVSLPQVPIPVTIGGHPFLVEIDEYASTGNGIAGVSMDPKASVGAARIIDIADVRHPKVISNIRLEVHMPANRAQIAHDPGFSTPAQGTAGHYCAVPRRDDPRVVACSFITSGLRVFDIEDPYHPREVAYFNAPMNDKSGNWAMSAPAFAPDRGEVWYTDGNRGFFEVKLTNGVANLLR